MDDMHMMHNKSGGGMNMPMYFHSGTMVTLFFKDWMTMSQTEYNGACTALFFVAALYEGLKILRKFIVTGKRNIISPMRTNPPTLQHRVIIHLIQTILHIIQVFFGYLLMLAFMTYNTLICVAILLGYGFGYFLFAWWTPHQNEDGEDSDCCNM